MNSIHNRPAVWRSPSTQWHLALLGVQKIAAPLGLEKAIPLAMITRTTHQNYWGTQQPIHDSPIEPDSSLSQSIPGMDKSNFGQIFHSGAQIGQLMDQYVSTLAQKDSISPIQKTSQSLRSINTSNTNSPSTTESETLRHSELRAPHSEMPTDEPYMDLRPSQTPHMVLPEAALAPEAFLLKAPKGLFPNALAARSMIAIHEWGHYMAALVGAYWFTDAKDCLVVDAEPKRALEQFLHFLNMGKALPGSSAAALMEQVQKNYMEQWADTFSAVLMGYPQSVGTYALAVRSLRQHLDAPESTSTESVSLSVPPENLEHQTGWGLLALYQNSALAQNVLRGILEAKDPQEQLQSQRKLMQLVSGCALTGALWQIVECAHAPQSASQQWIQKHFWHMQSTLSKELLAAPDVQTPIGKRAVKHQTDNWGIRFISHMQSARLFTKDQLHIRVSTSTAEHSHTQSVTAPTGAEFLSHEQIPKLNRTAQKVRQFVEDKELAPAVWNNTGPKSV